MNKIIDRIALPVCLLCFAFVLFCFIDVTISTRRSIERAELALEIKKAAQNGDSAKFEELNQLYEQRYGIEERD